MWNTAPSDRSQRIPSTVAPVGASAATGCKGAAAAARASTKTLARLFFVSNTLLQRVNKPVEFGE